MAKSISNSQHNVTDKMELINAKLNPYIKVVNACDVFLTTDFTSPFRFIMGNFYLIWNNFDKSGLTTFSSHAVSQNTNYTYAESN